MAMAAATALTSSAPLLVRHHYRRCCVFLPTITGGRLISYLHSNNANASKFTPLLLPRYPPPIAILDDSIVGNCSASIKSSSIRTRKHRTQLLLCYCTETEAAQNNNNTNSTSASNSITTLDGEEGDSNAAGAIIREAANTLDIRVGKIVKAWRHEEADSLYVEEVDVGEPEPRIICSGLVKYIPLHLLQDRNVIVLANLKPRNMRGVKSFGMLMAASDATHENIELLAPPEDAVPGDRVWFGSIDEKENLPDVASPNQVQKKKIWELVQPQLRTDDSCVATLGTNHQMRTSAGLIISQSLKNANIS